MMDRKESLLTIHLYNHNGLNSISNKKKNEQRSHEGSMFRHWLNYAPLHIKLFKIYNVLLVYFAILSFYLDSTRHEGKSGNLG